MSDVSRLAIVVDDDSDVVAAFVADDPKMVAAADAADAVGMRKANWRRLIVAPFPFNASI